MMKKDPVRSVPAGSPIITRLASGKASVTLVWTLAVALSVLSGFVYRLLAEGHHLVVDTPISLPVKLKEFPLGLNGWTGQDVNIPTVTLEYMRTHFVDDYFNRRYQHAETGRWADLYVVYCSSQPSRILGHKPTVCYPGSGWVWDKTTPSRIATRAGRTLDCLVHYFHKPAPAYEEIAVVNFYVVNGVISVSEGDFSGFWTRRLNIAGDPARYVAQVQVASAVETSAKMLACDTVDTVLHFLPNASESVGADAKSDLRPGESK
jgi:hypothetical protein